MTEAGARLDACGRPLPNGCPRSECKHNSRGVCCMRRYGNRMIIPQDCEHYATAHHNDKEAAVKTIAAWKRRRLPSRRSDITGFDSAHWKKKWEEGD
jgi:hypothetical protein